MTHSYCFSHKGMMMSQSAKTVVIVMQTDHEQVNDLIHNEFGAYKDSFKK